MKNSLLFFGVLIFAAGCGSAKSPAPDYGPTPEQRADTVEQVEQQQISDAERAANNRMGFDVLALMHNRTDAKAIGRRIKPGTPIGVLDYTFGTDIQHVRDLLSGGRVGVLRVHLINAVCARNRRCQPSDGVAYRKDSKGLDRAIRNGEADSQVRNRVRVFKLLFDEFHVPTWISPLLEHDQSQEAWVHLGRLIKEEWPVVRLVNSPHSGYGGNALGALIEHHGSTPSRDNMSSLDGDDLYSLGSSGRQRWRDRTRGEIATLSWTQQANCLGSGKWVAPLKRTNCLTARSFEKMYSQTYN